MTVEDGLHTPVVEGSRKAFQGSLMPLVLEQDNFSYIYKRLWRYACPHGVC